MKFLLILVLLQSIFQNYAQVIFGSCTTPGEQIGICIPLRECDYLFELLQRSPTASERTLLQRSQCGNRDGQVQICCAIYRSENNRQAQPPSVIDEQSQPEQTLSSRNSNLLPQAPNCGDNFADRILGGVNAGKQEFPWLALVEYRRSDNVTSHRCGGTLINNQYVLTAAHCVSGIPLNFRVTGVRLGEWDTNMNRDCTTERNGKVDCNDPHVDVSVSEIIPHSQYSASDNDQLHDIALLRLKSPVNFTQTISPICLPLRQEQQNNIFLGHQLVISGWGHTENNITPNIKQKAILESVPTAECHNRFFSQLHRTVTANQICAGGVNGIDSCRGDSGGPLVMLDMYGSSNYYLVGIVSYGIKPCGLDGWPGVYTLVSAYIEWIEATIRA
ncbi:melanization protease 1 isoform X2 [Drosophila grimshawi]|uniref:CLIP domain-containing serine protease n=1 Tax=Drosophila grimshawi TaxID=7222 RepID=B4JS10_DROGR|nr:melanization protease 1 isoform X2 [Drosophila grimshawi]EDV94550.1 GH17229 [Drosophila grimshawi]